MRAAWLVASLLVGAAVQAEAGKGARKARPWAVKRATPGVSRARPPYQRGLKDEQVADREREITAPDPRKRSFSIRLKGGRRLDVSQQIELERRWIIPGFSGPAPLEDGLRYVDQGHRIRNQQDLVRDLLDRFSVDGLWYTARRNATVVLAPLQSRFQHAHGAYGGPIELAPQPAAHVTRELQGNAIEVVRGRATLQRNYVVGLQHESGLYWDTPDQQLRAMGKTLREKRWSPIDDGGHVRAATSRVLFMKEQLGDAERGALGPIAGRFTARRETHAQLPLEIPSADVRAAAIELAVRAGIPRSVARRIQPTMRVETDRATVDILHKRDPSSDGTKIGFLTIDVYKTRSLLRGHGRKVSKPTIQLELELLDNGRDLYEKDPAGLDALVAELESTYGAQIDIAPKVEHGLRQRE